MAALVQLRPKIAQNVTEIRLIPFYNIYFCYFIVLRLKLSQWVILSRRVVHALSLASPINWWRITESPFHLIMTRRVQIVSRNGCTVIWWSFLCRMLSWLTLRQTCIVAYGVTASWNAGQENFVNTLPFINFVNQRTIRYGCFGVGYLLVAWATVTVIHLLSRVEFGNTVGLKKWDTSQIFFFSKSDLCTHRIRFLWESYTLILLTGCQ